MTENLLHFIWKNNHFLLNGLTTTTGEKLEVIDAGFSNQNAGPDFFNAKVKLNNTVWAGNIEMHINASDWFTHKHNSDSKYDNVILHVVVNADRPATSSKGVNIPTIAIKYPQELDGKLEQLLASKEWIPCSNQINKIDPITINFWIEKMMVERLENKTNQVGELVNSCNGNWEEAFYQSMAKSFGLKINALPSELMAKNTPLKILAKHKDNLFQLEAILFGQAGLLNSFDSDDEYFLSLKIEYAYLQKKFGIKPIDGSLWKFLRLRPNSFPTIRIAQLAMLIHQSSSLFSRIIETENINSIKKMIEVKTSSYWETHYVFGKQSPLKMKLLGKQAIEIIVLNTIIPFMFFYGVNRGNVEFKEKALKMLETINPESNSIVKEFRNIGITANSAFQSQALIHLKTNYCDNRKCIFCDIGTKILLKAPYL